MNGKIVKDNKGVYKRWSDRPFAVSLSSGAWLSGSSGRVRRFGSYEMAKNAATKAGVAL